MILTNLAIIIPYFKINFFEETLESLAAQTDQRFNVYIGDDASPDSPVELLEKYEGKFNFTYQKFEKNLGSISLTKQWERCIDMMQDEEWFMVLGDDDVLGENVVEEFYKNNKNIPKSFNIVSFNYQLINEYSLLSHKYIYEEEPSAIDLHNGKMNSIFMTSLSQFIFRKKKYYQYLFLDLPLAWGSDDYAVIEISENKPIFYLNSFVKIRISKSNISGKKELNNIKNESLILFYENLIKNHREKLNINQRRFVFHQYYNRLLIEDKFKFLKWYSFFCNIIFAKENLFFFILLFVKHYTKKILKYK